jgi:NADH:ubiquinone reductase (H+-translocating)
MVQLLFVGRRANNQRPPRLSSDVSDHLPQVVIVGGGFGGLAAAKALKNARAEVILIDRTNHHLFQPLLYQVATSELTPGQIGSPIRNILRKQRNTVVLLGEVTGVDRDERCVVVSDADRADVRLPYDYLILATGATHSYFGHEEFRKHAPGLKNLADAVSVRNKVLSAFEVAEAEEDPRLHRDLLTFVLVGAGPTGVEMASALAVLVRNTLRSEFRRIDPASARIVLVDQSPRVLGSFSEELSSAARKHLEALGVEVLSGRSVEKVDVKGVIVGGRADRQQQRHLDRGRGSVTGRQVAECGVGSRRTGACSTGRQRGRTSGNFCRRRHSDI